jgi:riboflavin kinase/FMN adenylyltransferase
MAEPRDRSVVTIGTFDGVHLGHRALLERTRELAAARGLSSVVLTFPRPPQNYLGRPKPLLMPAEKRKALLTKHVDQVVVVEFPEIQPLSPREFVTQILLERLRAAAVVVGEDFCFGRNRAGNTSTLAQLGRELGFEVHMIQPIFVDGERVSSTAIREALQEGNVERAAKLLGESPRLWGRVIPGEGQGRRLGCPTANLLLDPEVVLPAEGIYAARIFCKEVSREGALYIGRRPTLDGQRISVEVHLLDCPGELNLYGQELEAQVLRRLREDQRLATIEELREQIQKDLNVVRSFFRER